MDASGATACIPAGDVPVGAACSSQNCVSGAECLLPIAGVNAAYCMSFCSSDSPGCDCQFWFPGGVGVCAPVCGDGVISGYEECDGATLPGNAPAGSHCSANCRLLGDADAPLSVVTAPDNACGMCAESHCAPERQALDAQLAAAEPLIECVLGADWQSGFRASPDSCANQELSGCYCGGASPSDCSSAAPASLDGPCRTQILDATGCAGDASGAACVWPVYFDPRNVNGTVMQYVQCRQDFCFEECFN